MSDEYLDHLLNDPISQPEEALSNETVLPLCYCTAHDRPHVHLPVLRDSQYGLRVEVGEVPDPVPAPEEKPPADSLPRSFLRTLREEIRASSKVVAAAERAVTETEAAAAPAPRQTEGPTLGAGYSKGGISVHAIDPAAPSRTLCGSTIAEVTSGTFDPTAKHACPRCLAARPSSDTEPCKCGHARDEHGGPYGDGTCGAWGCPCEAFYPRQTEDAGHSDACVGRVHDSLGCSCRQTEDAEGPWCNASGPADAVCDLDAGHGGNHRGWSTDGRVDWLPTPSTKETPGEGGGGSGR